MKKKLLLVVALAVSALLCSNDVRAGGDSADQLGTIHFQVTGKSDAQEHVVRGVKLVHHMMYTEADREFVSAIAADPACAIAYWGRAMVLIHPVWPDTPSEADRKKGAEFVRTGLACSETTPRETAYLETLAQFFTEKGGGTYADGLKALDTAWGTLADRYPQDCDAVAFSALYHLAPARFLPKDKSRRIQLEAAARLEKVLATIPDHPGAQHYKIHAYDFPLLAGRALEVCDSYSSIAPNVPHALHMPTHIFTRQGLWEKSIDLNLRSAEAARLLARNDGLVSSHLPHALDYLMYAYLQRGQYSEAEGIRRQLSSLDGPYSAVNLNASAFAFAAAPARYALERQAWEEAARLPLHQPAAFAWGKQYLNCDSIVHFSRAIGAARSGQLDTARAEITELEGILEQLAVANRVSYWASQAETQLLAAKAWVEYASKNTDEAIVLMRRATELEATADKEAVTPGEVLPAGDLLGDMLTEAGRPTEALAAFESVLVSSPNRLNTLYGAGLAAERAGKSEQARLYYTQLMTAAALADKGVERVEHARAYLAGQSVAVSH